MSIIYNKLYAHSGIYDRKSMEILNRYELLRDIYPCSLLPQVLLCRIRSAPLVLLSINRRGAYDITNGKLYLKN